MFFFFCYHNLRMPCLTSELKLKSFLHNMQTLTYTALFSDFRASYIQQVVQEIVNHNIEQTISHCTHRPQKSLAFHSIRQCKTIELWNEEHLLTKILHAYKYVHNHNLIKHNDLN